MVFAMTLGLVLGAASVLLIGQWLRGELIAAPDAAAPSARRPARRHPARTRAHPAPRSLAVRGAPRRRGAA